MVENYVTPGQYRHMRACMVCAVVMLHSRFLREGCPNCEEYLHLKHSSEQIDACTSQVFEGVITLANPLRSWIARWQRLDKYVPGAYAIKVSGQLPDEILAVLEEERVAYVPRDGTQNDAD